MAKGGLLPRANGGSDDPVPEMTGIQLAGDVASVMESPVETQPQSATPTFSARSTAPANASPRRRRTCANCLIDSLESFGSDIFNDLAARLPLYASDWLTTDGRRCTSAGVVKIASASLFSYISSILPAIVIGDLLFSSTGGQLGLPEVRCVAHAELLYIYSFDRSIYAVGVRGGAYSYTALHPRIGTELWLTRTPSGSASTRNISINTSTYASGSFVSPIS